jgi:hypothetical protein
VVRSYLSCYLELLAVASTKLVADKQLHQGPEEGSDPEDSRIQVGEGSGGVEFRYLYSEPHIPVAS